MGSAPGGPRRKTISIAKPRESVVKFLIKDLSRMTSFSPARIRKWQERYQIFRPMQGSNGYWYYSNEDYLVLRSIQQRLAMGQKLNHIMTMGREHLLANLIADDFQPEDWRIIQSIKDGDYEGLQNGFEQQRGKCETYMEWMRDVIQPVLVTVGRSWESGYLSITEEHAFSRWLHGYLLQTTRDFPEAPVREWLVAVYPGDQHELGAIMHYCVLRSRGKGVRFAGMLPREELLRELRDGEYERVSISVVMPQTQDKLDQLERDVQKVAPATKVHFGGIGVSQRPGRQRMFPENSRRDDERLAELEREGKLPGADGADPEDESEAVAANATRAGRNGRNGRNGVNGVNGAVGNGAGLNGKTRVNGESVKSGGGRKARS